MSKEYEARYCECILIYTLLSNFKYFSTLAKLSDVVSCKQTTVIKMVTGIDTAVEFSEGNKKIKQKSIANQ